MTNPSTDRYDVVVVGSRCAGAATALLLARAGHDVLIVDKATLPSDTNSTHSLARGGVIQLSRWGLLDQVLAGGAPPIRSVTFHRHDQHGALAATFAVKNKSGVDHMLAPRRHLMDQILAHAAVSAGAELLDRTVVREVRRDRTGRVSGLAAVGPRGRHRHLTATMVIGADGVRSSMAASFGAATTEEHGPSGACFYAYVGDAPWDGFEFHIAEGAFAGAFPTHFGEACVWLMLPAGSAGPILGAGRGRMAAWRRALRDLVPTLADRVDAGIVRGPVRGAVGLPNRVRQAAGPGWALVGDAGYHRDPITGHGMTDAFRDAELLARAVDVALRDPAAARDALAEYERARDDALAETFRITRALGEFPSPDRFVELQTELSRALDVEAELLAALPGVSAVPLASAATY